MMDRTGAPLALNDLPRQEGHGRGTGRGLGDRISKTRLAPRPLVSESAPARSRTTQGKSSWSSTSSRTSHLNSDSDEIRELLYNVYEALGSSLDRDENLQSLARALVPRMGTWCAVHLLDGGLLMPVAAVYPDEDNARNLVQVAGSAHISLDEDRLAGKGGEERGPRSGRPNHRGDARAGGSH